MLNDLKKAGMTRRLFCILVNHMFFFFFMMGYNATSSDAWLFLWTQKNRRRFYMQGKIFIPTKKKTSLRELQIIASKIIFILAFAF